MRPFPPALAARLTESIEDLAPLFDEFTTDKEEQEVVDAVLRRLEDRAAAEGKEVYELVVSVDLEFATTGKPNPTAFRFFAVEASERDLENRMTVAEVMTL